MAQEAAAESVALSPTQVAAGGGQRAAEAEGSPRSLGGTAKGSGSAAAGSGAGRRLPLRVGAGTALCLSPASSAAAPGQGPALRGGEGGSAPAGGVWHLCDSEF